MAHYSYLSPDRRSVTQFNVSRDEREVAFTSMTPTGTPEVWLASIDRSRAPRRISESADQVAFAGPDLVFRSLENTLNFIMRIGKDGSGRRRVMDTPILGRLYVSADGKWATAGVAGALQSTTPGTLAISLETGTTRPDPTTYAFVKRDVQRNLFRIPLR